ncbi:MAG: HlyD family efflux transporter periplasmic adaptor subunit [Bacteroidetes bacterium]|nr:HlyD family efflux transporter periplasmic adaptor subunit [Bacteroidota bacterium]
MKETDRRKVEAQKNHRARQTEVQEIISRPPSAIVTWGLTVFSFVFISTLFLTWFIRYPDIIKAKIVITTEPAPINLFSRASGKIALLKIENSSLNKGEIVAYIESNARPKDIILADSLVMLPDSMAPKSTKPLILGDLQNAFSLWEKAKESKSFYYKNQVASKQIDHIERQISTYKRLAYTAMGQLKIIHEEVALAKSRFKTDSILFHQKVTSANDFSKAKTDYLVQQRNVKNSEMALINNEVQIGSLEKQITELRASKLENEGKLNLEAEQARKELISQILKWEDTYLFTSQIDGSLSYLDFLENGKFVEAGKPLFSIVPYSKKIVGWAELPITGSGKVKVGLQVNIRLDNFPYEQYGMLRGTVKEISSLPNQGKYLVKIDLADTLKTTTKKKITFKQQMQGETEIITEDLRLIDRFFYQMVKTVRGG